MGLIDRFKKKENAAPEQGGNVESIEGLQERARATGYMALRWAQ